ncbi:isochorismatase family protein [Micromonospora sp. WMMD812]|uniref:isochorismatase family protein n=1 Tax=Micromonospora sp. WMMD812 TaxID=3015152 RepID=UPI00248AECDD|nr:isochorismatase family protein [Micromonospora sp. WMMD812]WBB68044.1 isochorismatase family protein [Micromonospora sp. WMMD812]
MESTAQAAYEHGYHVTLAVDAMADLDAEAHRNSVERIFPRLGETGGTGGDHRRAGPDPGLKKFRAGPSGTGQPDRHPGGVTTLRSAT